MRFVVVAQLEFLLALVLALALGSGRGETEQDFPVFVFDLTRGVGEREKIELQGKSTFYFTIEKAEFGNPLVKNKYYERQGPFSLIVDTSSSVVAVPSKDCAADSCGDHARYDGGLDTKDTVGPDPNFIHCSDDACLGYPQQTLVKTCSTESPAQACVLQYVYVDELGFNMTLRKSELCIHQKEVCLPVNLGLIHNVILSSESSKKSSNKYREQNVDGVVGINGNSPLFQTIQHFSLSLHPSAQQLSVGSSISFEEPTRRWTKMEVVVSGMYTVEFNGLHVGNRHIDIENGILEINTGSWHSLLSKNAFNNLRKHWYAYCDANAKCVGRPDLGTDRESLGCYEMQGNDLRAFYKSFPSISLRVFAMDNDNKEKENRAYLSFKPEEYFFAKQANVYCVGLYSSEDGDENTEIGKNIFTLGASLIRWVQISNEHEENPQDVKSEVEISIPFSRFVLFDLKESKISFPFTHTFYDDNKIDGNSSDQWTTGVDNDKEDKNKKKVPMVDWTIEGGLLFQTFIYSFIISLFVCVGPCIFLRKHVNRRKAQKYGRIGEDEIASNEHERTIEMAQTWSQEIPASAYEIGGSSDEETDEDSLDDQALGYAYSYDDESKGTALEKGDDDDTYTYDELERAENLLRRGSTDGKVALS
uniref:Peptidase A1 domain-containing protein n=1 Tax=Aplanochytrium stocchinoi TaxID=215587 RepID=A0A7S3PMD4_9STRA